MALGEGVYLMDNNTARHDGRDRAESRWLSAQVPVCRFERRVLRAGARRRGGLDTSAIDFQEVTVRASTSAIPA